jgi:hypothetical protein
VTNDVGTALTKLLLIGLDPLLLPTDEWEVALEINEGKTESGLAAAAAFI